MGHDGSYVGETGGDLMAWTRPRTWAAGDVISASLLNPHLRDNLIAAHGTVHPAVRVTRASNQAIPTGSYNTSTTAGVEIPRWRPTSIDWSTFTFDTADMWPGGEEIVIPSGADGVWEVGAMGQWEDNSGLSNNPGLWIERNGVDGSAGVTGWVIGHTIEEAFSSTNEMWPTCSADVRLVAGDTLATTVGQSQQSTGTTVNISACAMWATWVAD